MERAEKVFSNIGRSASDIMDLIEYYTEKKKNATVWIKKYIQYICCMACGMHKNCSKYNRGESYG